MSDIQEEIKEILEIFKKINEEYSIDTELDFEDYEIPNIYLKQFLDYITNLQEENKKLKDLCNKYEEEHNNAFKLWTMKMEEMPDYEERMNYKLRNEKAIEYINSTGYGTDFSMSAEEVDKVLNILKGVDKE